MNNIIEKELNTGLNNPINNNTNTAVSPQCDEDYEVIDGIKHCPICHEPVEKVYDVDCLGHRLISVGCKCRQEEQVREKELEEMERHRKI